MVEIPSAHIRQRHADFAHSRQSNPRHSWQCPTSASRVESLRQTLSRQRLIKFCKSYLHSLCRRCNKRFSLSKANASAVMLRATTSRFENFGATPHRGMFPNSFTRFLVSSLQIPKILTKFTLELRISNAIVLSCLVIV